MTLQAASCWYRAWLGSCLAVHETFAGMGSMKCYGDMSITVRSGDDEGFLTCSPAWGSAVAPPQVIQFVRSHPIMA